MATPPSEPDASAAARSLTLYIKSPAAAIPERLALPNTSLATTVHEVKCKLRDALPIRPAPESQKLLYAGRQLANPDATLAQILGPDFVRADLARDGQAG